MQGNARIAAGIAVVALVGAGAAVAAGPSTQSTRGAQQSATALSAAERSAVVYMREEEKLSRDVYVELSKAYPSSPIFGRIARAEQQHMNAVGRLLARYGVADPVAGKAPGVFMNSDLHRLYDTLVERGLRSLDDALQVGVTIEKTDIADIEVRLRSVDHTDVDRVLSSLLRGSQSHLGAFTRTAQAEA